MMLRSRIRSLVGFAGNTTAAPVIRADAARSGLSVQTPAQFAAIPNQLKKILHRLDGLNNVPMDHVRSAMVTDMLSLAEKVRQMTDSLPNGSEPRTKAQESIEAMGKRGLLSRVARRKEFDNNEYEQCVIKAYLALLGELPVVKEAPERIAPTPAVKIEPAPVTKMEELKAALKDPERQCQALRDLEGYGAEAAPALPEIIEILDSALVGTTRFHRVLDALESIGPAAMPATMRLRKLITHPKLNHYGFYILCGAIYRIEGKASIPFLMSLLKVPVFAEKPTVAFIISLEFHSGPGTLAICLRDMELLPSTRALLIRETLKRFRDSEKYYRNISDHDRERLKTIADAIRELEPTPNEDLREAAEIALRMLGPYIS